MQFATPTTKNEMYQILREIFYYYRIRKDPFEELELSMLELERLEFTPLSTLSISSKARKILKPVQTQRINQYVAGLDQKITELNAKLSSLPTKKQTQTDAINSRYASSLEKLERVLSKNGLNGTSVAINELSRLEANKNAELSALENSILDESSNYSAQIEALTERKNSASTHFSQMHEQEIGAKEVALMDEQDKIEREVFKYNNGLDEKEQRYRNTLIQIRSNAMNKYNEINQIEYSKDQLIEMGYYTDAIKCVTAYYDTIDPAQAQSDFLQSERGLMVYLDEYYSDLLYTYRLRAEG